jgi:predicted nucleic acid-binding protein
MPTADVLLPGMSSMSAKYFLDTNILVYSFSKKDTVKRKKAINLLDNALKQNQGCISFQVIQEFLNVALKKFAVPLSYKDCQEFLLSALEPLCEIHSSVQLYYKTLDISDKWRFSLYDSMIIAAALQAGCGVLYSEDLQHGQKIQDLKIINPFI